MSDERRHRITVREMIELLSAFDPDVPVVVDAYEMGILSPKPPRLALLAMADEGINEGMFGEFEECGTASPQTFTAVYLAR